MDARDYVAYLEAAEHIDVRKMLSELSVPTLAVSTGNLLTPGLQGLPDLTRQLAREIPKASFVESNDLAKVIDGFLREGGPVRDAPIPSGTAVILFADIADSTALTERLGDAAFRAKARELDAALRGVIGDHAGTPIEGKLLGDGVLAVFTSARQAIEAALACGRAGGDAGLPLHLGLHAGDVIREEGNVYGGAVNIASRISGLSAPGEVLVSDVVRALARTSAGVVFEDRGERELKGVGEAVRVWAVREGE
jgi:class 3 adenylate cyclase